MGKARISRRRFVAAGAVSTLGVLLAPEAVLAEGDHKEKPELLRWDLIQIVDGVVLVGGTDVSRDAASHDMVSLTGSGEAEPKKHKATGGGTFVHQHANGSLVASGVYYVTGFKSFVNGGGSLAQTGLIDGIGKLTQTDGGILTMNVHAIVDAPFKGAVDGVLAVHCQLPGGEETPEGVRLSVLTFDFVQDSAEHGFTLFHVLDD